MKTFKQFVDEATGNALLDNKNKTCKKCKKGTYGETSMQDDWDGVVHCDKCGHEITRHEKHKVKTSLAKIK